MFVASAVWDIPFGANRRSQRSTACSGALVNDWTLTGVLTLQSGMPIAVTQTTNNNAFAGFGTQRPNLIGDPDAARRRAVGQPVVQHERVRGGARSSRSARARAIRCAGPGYRNLDLAVMRRVPLPASKALEARAEVFNVTNTPPLGAPNSTVGSAAFGTITSAGDPRVVQLALKFIF